MRADAVIVSCEHAGARVPARFVHAFAGKSRLLASHRAFDRGALALANALARRLRVGVIAYPYTRLLIDPNRSEHHRALYSEITRRLSREDRQTLLERYYRPHRARVFDAVEKAVGSGARVVHLAAHSFTPRLDGDIRNADVAFLYDPRRRPERKLVAMWCANLAIDSALMNASLRVRRNYPYRGVADGLTTALRRRFAARDYLGIEVEMNQVLMCSRARHRRVVEALAATAAETILGAAG